MPFSNFNTGALFELVPNSISPVLEIKLKISLLIKYISPELTLRLFAFSIVIFCVSNEGNVPDGETPIFISAPCESKLISPLDDVRFIPLLPASCDIPPFELEELIMMAFE